MTQTIQNWKHRGMLYTVDNTTAETTVDVTPRRTNRLLTQGVESGVTVDEANNQIIINVAGDYLVTANVSFSGSQSNTFRVAIYKNTTTTGFRLERKLGTGGDVGAAGVNGIVTCAATDVISLYRWSTDGGTVMTITNAQLSVVRIG